MIHDKRFGGFGAMVYLFSDRAGEKNEDRLNNSREMRDGSHFIHGLPSKKTNVSERGECVLLLSFCLGGNICLCPLVSKFSRTKTQRAKKDTFPVVLKYNQEYICPYTNKMSFQYQKVGPINVRE